MLGVHGALEALLSMCGEQVLKDIHHGWPGQCVGLAVVQARTLETCRISCTNDPRRSKRFAGAMCGRCSVWQFNPGQVEGGCWQGQGQHCETRNGFATVQFSGGRGGCMARVACVAGRGFSMAA